LPLGVEQGGEIDLAGFVAREGRPEGKLGLGEQAEPRADNLALVEGFRAVKQAAEDAGDNATSGIVDDWTDQAEQRAWFLFETGRTA